MKKQFFILFIAVMALFFTVSCSSPEPQNPRYSGDADLVSAKPFMDSLKKEWKRQEDSLAKENKKIADNIAISRVNEIPVGEGNFNALVSFIQKNGFLVPQRGVKSDFQYTFFDKRGNRHAMIAEKRDKDKNPSTKGTVDMIAVWAYENGIKDQKHFFGYYITKEKVAPFTYDIDGGWEHANYVRFGYEEFLAKVKKH